MPENIYMSKQTKQTMATRLQHAELNQRHVSRGFNHEQFALLQSSACVLYLYEPRRNGCSELPLIQ